MKKKYFILLIIILLVTTGCRCEYNLNIKDNSFTEEVILNAENNNEQSSLNNKWQIPVDKDEYNIGTDPGANNEVSSNLYDYNLNGNKLAFNHTFNLNNFKNSAAVSNCYDKLTATSYGNSIIISTTNNAICFDKYPTLSSVVINITVDRNVTSHNADKVSGNTYTWNVDRSNYNKKGINLVLENNTGSNSQNNIPNNNSNNQQTNNNRDYTMYIFAGILLVVFMIGYLIFNKMKNKEEDV